MRVEPIRDKALIQKALTILKQDESEQGKRRYLMFMSGIYLGRRICDYQKMKVGDVLGREKFVIREQKTKKTIELFIPRSLSREYTRLLAGRDREEWLFQSPIRDRITGEEKPYCYKTFDRDMQAIKKMLLLPEQYNLGTHSMRKTFGYHYYQLTHDIATLMKLFNHSKEETTLIYIGIESDEMRTTFRKIDRMYEL